MAMKVKEVIERLESEGWVMVRQESSHRQFKKEGDPNVITVSGKLSATVPVGTLGNIKRKAGWNE